MNSDLTTATFGAGCFWGVQDRFDAISGVVSTTVGYMGGHRDQPTYREVCGKNTGHAEVVQVRYDEARVPYEKLLNVFFNIHHPIGERHNDEGVQSQYRSVAFWHDEKQREALEARIETLNRQATHGEGVATQVQPASEQTFWRAEDYHQHYHRKNG